MPAGHKNSPTGGLRYVLVLIEQPRHPWPVTGAGAVTANTPQTLLTLYLTTLMRSSIRFSVIRWTNYTPWFWIPTWCWLSISRIKEAKFLLTDGILWAAQIRQEPYEVTSAGLEIPPHCKIPPNLPIFSLPEPLSAVRKSHTRLTRRAGFHKISSKNTLD